MSLAGLGGLAVYTVAAEAVAEVAAAVVRKPTVEHHLFCKPLATANNMHKSQFFWMKQYIQVKKEEFLASVPELLHCEFRKDFARYVRAKDQLIGLPPSV
jgi:hypothetical protein